ncbi:MAG: hypothetical protein HQ518_00825, partial [Rhodopirellula sp.]|nr:hypothetical protein [Rhodopirellula sp.]
MLKLFRRFAINCSSSSDSSLKSLVVALARMTSKSDSRLLALAETTSIVGLSADQRREVIQALIDENDEVAAELISKSMLAASTAEQQRIAEVLASDSTGAGVLIALAESGRASSRLLKHPQIEQKLLAVSSENLKERMAMLTRGLRDESEELLQL